ncbi:hypothetical protein NLI96_g4779 [Meripilus lineatus]|uniref:Uncharacterized protein n=1 Tax=Meripilus lineatus TaxID=2056292 RepID=A0AAD5V9J4_9APHY|nr:hypothetical protein NLI96_g4779 [Physisporinus lineatus]
MLEAAAERRDDSSSEEHTSKLIPRPPNEKFSLEKYSGWKRPKYLAFRRDIRRLITEAQIKSTSTGDFRRVDHKKLGLVYKAAYAIYPSLKRFEDNWFLDVAARRTLQNRRRGIRRSQKKLLAAANSGEESHDESEEDEAMD